MNNENRQFDFLDLLNILSFYIGWRNLIENQAQSEYNDVHKANAEQAEELLRRIEKLFSQQNAMLERQTAMLEEILERLDGMG